MSVRLSRRTWVAVIAAAALVVGACIGFGPFVRWRIGAEAARRRIELKVDAVGPDWFGVRLRGVVVHPAGFAGVEARVSEVRVSFGLGMHADSLRLSGASVLLTGSASGLREAWTTWRGDERPQSQSKRSATPLVSVDGLSAVWREADPSPPRVEIRGVQLVRDQEGLRAKVDDARLRFGSATVAVSATTCELSASGALTRARAASVLVDWAAAADSSSRSDAELDEQADEPASAVSPSARNARRVSACRRSRPPSTSSSVARSSRCADCRGRACVSSRRPNPGWC